MIKQKGAILKFKNDLAIIMTSDCKIVSIIKQPGMYVGLEVLFNKNEIVKKKSKIVISSQIVAGVAAIFIILFVFFNPFNSNGVYAYVAIDCNTSVEFELDKNNKILKVNYFNEDSSDLLKELDLKHQSVDVAIREVIKKTNSSKSTVLISACLKEQRNMESAVSVKNESEEFKKLVDICKSVVEANINENTRLKVVETPYDYKKMADINKISIGRSIVYEKAKEQGIDFNIEDIKSQSIGEALKKVKIDDVGVVHNVKKVESEKPVLDQKRELPIPVEKKDPLPIIQHKDILEERPEPKPKEKVEEKVEIEPKDEIEVKEVIEPTDNLEERPEPKPKEKVEEKVEIEPKDELEVKEVIEPTDNLEERPEPKPKEKVEEKVEIEPKDEIEVKEVIEPTDNLEERPEPKPKEKVEEKVEIEPKDELEVKEEIEPTDNLEERPEPKPKEKVEEKVEIEPKDELEVKEEIEPKDKLEEKDQEEPELQP